MFRDRYGLKSGAFVAILALCMVLVSTGLVVGIMEATWRSTRTNCNGVHDNTGLETKFVRYSYWNWDCFVKVDGQWTPYDRWVSVHQNGEQW